MRTPIAGTPPHQQHTAGTFRFFHYLQTAAATAIRTKPAGRTEMAQVCKIVCERYKLPHRQRKPRKSKEKRVCGGWGLRRVEYISTTAGGCRYYRHPYGGRVVYATSAVRSERNPLQKYVNAMFLQRFFANCLHISEKSRTFAVPKIKTAERLNIDFYFAFVWYAYPKGRRGLLITRYS